MLVRSVDMDGLLDIPLWGLNMVEPFRDQQRTSMLYVWVRAVLSRIT